MRINQRIAGVLYCLLFPGFLIYQTGLASGYWTSFLAGGFGPIAALGAVLGGISLPAWLKKSLWADPLVTVLWLLFLIIFFLTTFYWSFSVSEIYIQDAISQSWQSFLFFIALFYVGFYCRFDSVWLSGALIISGLFLVAFLSYYTFSTGRAMFYARDFFDSDTSVATYQGFARSAFFIFLPIICFARSGRGILFWSILATYSLFVLGARSEFFGFIIALAGILAVRSVETPRFFVVMMSVLLILISVIPFALSFLMDSRQLEVLDLANSTSWQARQSLQALSLELLMEKPWFGEFGSHIRISGSAGGYVHNILSSWMNYGVATMLLYSGCLLTVVAISIVGFLTDRQCSSEWLFSACVSVSSTVLLVVSKPVFWPVPAFCIGLYLGITHRRRHATL